MHKIQTFCLILLSNEPKGGKQGDGLYVNHLKLFCSIKESCKVTTEWSRRANIRSQWCQSEQFGLVAIRWPSDCEQGGRFPKRKKRKVVKTNALTQTCDVQQID